MTNTELYDMYVFNCRMQGDIWNEDNREYTYQEWIDVGMPENGGIQIKRQNF